MVGEGFDEGGFDGGLGRGIVRGGGEGENSWKRGCKRGVERVYKWGLSGDQEGVSDKVERGGGLEWGCNREWRGGSRGDVRICM